MVSSHAKPNQKSHPQYSQPFPTTCNSDSPCFIAGDSNQLPLEKGELVSVVSTDIGDGWTEVINSDGDEGFVPTQYICPCGK